MTKPDDSLLINDKDDRILRHPEKAWRPENTPTKKPEWLKVKAPGSIAWAKTNSILKKNKITTVCQEASCPNIAECWQKKHATFLLMGDICTRACAFCNVATGRPSSLDATEPLRVAETTHDLGLSHVVLTSVDRDDLSDGGGAHFVETIYAIRERCPETTIEVLVPDFLKKEHALELVVSAMPDVFNHNIETVPSLYTKIRPGARYFHSLRLLQEAKEIAPSLITKSGMMLGLGEDRNEILQVMDDMRCANIDFLTLGQYLAPSLKHHPVARYVPPDEFESLKQLASLKGFLYVSSSPFTRSSHHAEDDFRKIQQARALQSLR